MIDLNGLCKVALANAEQRQKNGGHIKSDTRSMLKHCATEVVEAAEANLDLMMYKSQVDSSWTDRDADNWLEKPRERFASELADIICCVLIIAGKEGIDIETAVNECVEKNRKLAKGTGDKL